LFEALFHGKPSELSGRVSALDVEVGDGCHARPAAEVGLELVEVSGDAFGHDLDRAVGQVLRITYEIECLSLAPNQPTKADSLHNPSRYGAQSCTLVQGIPSQPRVFHILFIQYLTGTAGYTANSDEGDGLYITLGTGAHLMPGFGQARPRAEVAPPR
jgi:hypothetical protein